MSRSVDRLDITVRQGFWMVTTRGGTLIALDLDRGLCKFIGTDLPRPGVRRLQWYGLRAVETDGGTSGSVRVGSCHQWLLGLDLAVSTPSVTSIAVPRVIGLHDLAHVTVKSLLEVRRAMNSCTALGVDPYVVRAQLPDGCVVPLAVAEEDWHEHYIELVSRRRTK